MEGSEDSEAANLRHELNRSRDQLAALGVSSSRPDINGHILQGMMDGGRQPQGFSTDQGGNSGMLMEPSYILADAVSGMWQMTCECI